MKIFIPIYTDTARVGMVSLLLYSMPIGLYHRLGWDSGDCIASTLIVKALVDDCSFHHCARARTVILTALPTAGVHNGVPLSSPLHTILPCLSLYRQQRCCSRQYMYVVRIG